MSSIVTNTARHRSDHFEPEAVLEPHEARKLRGHLEQIDFAAFAANRAVVGKALGGAELHTFERLAVAAAHARTEWVSAAIALVQSGAALSGDQVAQLAALRAKFEELTEAYEALRRMVERGYLSFAPKA